MTAREPRRARIPRFFAGAKMLGRGFSVWRTAPGLMLLGLVPAVIVAGVFFVGIVALTVNLESIVTAVTPFADRWDEPLAGGFRIILALAFVIVAVLIVINGFTAITLAVGQPFYERIWKHVEKRSGVQPQPSESSFGRAILRAASDGLRMLVPTLLAAVLLFVLGFIPVVGTIVAAALGLFFGGWFLAIELTGPPFESRGFTLRGRLALLRVNRSEVLGFGMCGYLVFLLPLGAVLMMPVAVAGAALLSTHLLGLEDQRRALPNQVVTPSL